MTNPFLYETMSGTDMYWFRYNYFDELVSRLPLESKARDVSTQAKTKISRLLRSLFYVLRLLQLISMCNDEFPRGAASKMSLITRLMYANLLEISIL